MLITKLSKVFFSLTNRQRELIKDQGKFEKFLKLAISTPIHYHQIQKTFDYSSIIYEAFSNEKFLNYGQMIPIFQQLLMRDFDEMIKNDQYIAYLQFLEIGDICNTFKNLEDQEFFQKFINKIIESNNEAVIVETTSYILKYFDEIIRVSPIVQKLISHAQKSDQILNKAYLQIMLQLHQVNENQQQIKNNTNAIKFEKEMSNQIIQSLDQFFNLEYQNQLEVIYNKHYNLNKILMVYQILITLSQNNVIIFNFKLYKFQGTIEEKHINQLIKQSQSLIFAQLPNLKSYQLAEFCGFLKQQQFDDFEKKLLIQENISKRDIGTYTTTSALQLLDALIFMNFPKGSYFNPLFQKILLNKEEIDYHQLPYLIYAAYSQDAPNKLDFLKIFQKNIVNKLHYYQVKEIVLLYFTYEIQNARLNLFSYIISSQSLAKQFVLHIQRKISALDMEDIALLVTLFTKDMGESSKKFKATVIEKARNFMLSNLKEYNFLFLDSLQLYWVKEGESYQESEILQKLLLDFINSELIDDDQFSTIVTNFLKFSVFKQKPPKIKKELINAIISKSKEFTEISTDEFLYPIQDFIKIYNK